MGLPIRPPGGSGNAKQLKTVDISDFRGGLNLSDDLFKVQPTESPDMLNMDVHARGGLVLRGGMSFESAQYTGTYLHSDVFRFLNDSGAETSYVMSVADDGGLTVNVETVGPGTISPIVLLPTDVPLAPEGLVSAQMNDRVTITSKKYRPKRGEWNGTTLSWADNVEATTTAGPGLWGTANAVPRGNAVAVWDNRMWVASTIEDGVDHWNRIRYSSDGDSSTWAETDWIDVDVGEDGDRITALAVYGEVLVIFKQRSVYGLLQDADPAILYNRIDISQSVGATGPDAVVSTQHGLMFWDGRSGLNMWREGQPQPIGGSISEAIQEERIPYDANARLSWVNERLWVSVNLDGARTVLVFDPRLGAWTRYDPSVEKVFAVGTERWGFCTTLNRWLSVDNEGALDDLGAGTVTIPSHWVSPWIHGGSHIVPKRWRRPRFVLASTDGGQIDVQVRADLDPRTDVRQFFLNLPARVTFNVWGGSTWGGTVYTNSAPEYSELVQGPAVGNFKSMQFRVDGPNILSRWRMDAVTTTYKPKVVRS